MTFASLAAERRIAAAPQNGAARYHLPLDGDWLFGGKFTDEALRREFDDYGSARVTLPHSVAQLSWQDWDPAAWEPSGSVV